MATEDSLVIDSIFGGAKDKNSSATLQRAQNERKARKGAKFATLKTATLFLQHLTKIFVKLAETVQSISRLLVSLSGLVLTAAALAYFIKAMCSGTLPPIESVLFMILRLSMSRIRH